MSDSASVAVVTGEHSFDVPNFCRLFRGLEGIDAYVQHLEHFASTPEPTRDAYDAVLFFNMHRETPSDEGSPWWAGKPRSTLERLTERGQGIVLLHHAILAFPQWERWHRLTGIVDRSFDYAPGVTLNVEVVDRQHFITEGLSDWEMIDETYKMADTDQDSHPLLAVDHEKSMKCIAWTRECDSSRVFCFASGHDQQTWSNPNFREVLRRGVRWVARL
jgi:type 1 glutamine amidotransferase